MKATGTFIKTGIFALLAVAFMATTTLAQERGNDKPRQSPNASVSQTIGTTVVSITYGRPSVRGRHVFGELEPFGKVWRTGANEATTITFSDDVQIGGRTLEAGTYGLFTIPEEEEWTIIFNNVPAQWGAFDYDSSQDALRVKAEPQKADTREQFMIHFENVTDTSADVVLHWENTKVPFTVET